MSTHIRRSVAAFALSLAGVAGLAGCGADSATVSDSTESATSAPSSSAAETTQNPKFGQTATWSDGLAIKVSTPAAYTPSSTAFTSGTGTPLVFTITVTNGTKANVDPDLVYITAQSGGKESDAVFDSEQQVGETPSTALLPGKTVEYKVAFMFADPNDITMQVDYFDLDKESIIFTN